MHKLILALFFIFHAPVVMAEEKPVKLQRFSAGAQNIQLVFATYIEKDCSSKGESRLAIVTPPRHGKLTSSPAVDFSNFGETGAHAKCNDKKIPGLKVHYLANDGFKGKDKFAFLVIYMDGDTRRYEVDMTVW